MKAVYEKRRSYQSVQFCISKGTKIEDREIHSYHEILFYMGGDAVFLTESYRKMLKPATLLFIPAGYYHYFKLMEPRQFVRMKIKIPQTLLSETPAETVFRKIRIREITDEFIPEVLRRMTEELEKESATPEGDFLLFTAMWMLLSEELCAKATRNVDAQETQIREIIRYIEENLSGDVSVSGISSAMHMSPSSVSHGFRKHMGVSVHRYVTEKRLSLADRRIAANEKPSKIFLQCGFKDYSAFYKAYMKMYGHAPSER